MPNKIHPIKKERLYRTKKPDLSLYGKAKVSFSFSTFSVV